MQKYHQITPKAKIYKKTFYVNIKNVKHIDRNKFLVVNLLLFGCSSVLWVCKLTAAILIMVLNLDFPMQ